MEQITLKRRMRDRANPLWWPSRHARRLSLPAMPAWWGTGTQYLLEPRRRAVAACIAVLAIAAVLMIPAFDSPAPVLDEGLLVSFPARLLDGELPQRDFYDPYGPASVLTVAGAFEVFGESLQSERLVGMAYRLLVISGAFGLALCWGLGAALVGATLVAATLVGSVGAPASTGYWALALLGYALLARALLRPTRGSKLIPTAGVLLAASVLMRIDFLPATVLAAIPTVLVIPKPDRKRFAVGVGVVLALLVFYVALVGPHSLWRSLQIGLGARGKPERPPFISDLAEIVALYMLGTALLLGAGLLIERRARRDPEARILLGVGLWGVGMAPFSLTKLDVPHVIISLTPVLAMLPVAALVLIRENLLQRPTSAAARRFALAAVIVVGFFACAEAIRFPLYHQANELVTGSREPSFLVTNAGRSFRLASPQQAQEVQATIAALDRLAHPGESLFVGPQDLRTAGINDVFLYFLLPQLKPASYFTDVDVHTINRPGNEFVRELSRADFLILEATPPPTPTTELGPPIANQIVTARFCVRAENGSYRLYQRCH